MTQKFIFSFSFVFLLSFFSPLLVIAKKRSINISSAKQENLYIRLDRSLSDIGSLVEELSDLDSDVHSPLHLLKKHIADGFVIGLEEEVLQVLEYADWFLTTQQDSEDKRNFEGRLSCIVSQVLEGALTVDEDMVIRDNALQLLKINERISVLGKALFKNDVVIEKNLYVHGKASFHEDVSFKDDVHFEDEVKFKDSVKFKDKVKFEDNVKFEENIADSNTYYISKNIK